MIRNKIKQGVAFGLLFATLLTPTFSFAKTTQEVIEDQPTSIYAPSSYEIEEINDDLLTPSSQSIPYQDYTQSKQKNEYTKTPLVKGGNLKAVNPLATKENKARGTVLENVDKTGKDITPTGDAKKDKDNPVDVRQFLTFQTKSGKTMHLIVDHSAEQENVQLLTEVGEQDLLNMIEADEGTKEVRPIVKEEPVQKEEPIKKEEPEEKDATKEKDAKKENSGSFIIIALAVVGAAVAAYYFKVVKNKDQKDMEDFEEDDDEDYISESDEIIDNSHEDDEFDNSIDDDEDDDDLL